MEKHIKNVIFDFGGVLLDWNPRYLYRNYFEREDEMEYFLRNICTDEWNVRQDGGRSFAEGISELQQLYPEYDEAIRIYFDRWGEMLKGEIKKNVDWLRQLKSEGYGIYGLTNWSAETIPQAYTRFEFLQLFDGIVVSGEEHLLKPDERIYRVLLDRYHLIPENCLFVDDNEKNLEGARKVGISTLNANLIDSM